MKASWLGVEHNSRRNEVPDRIVIKADRRAAGRKEGHMNNPGKAGTHIAPSHFRSDRLTDGMGYDPTVRASESKLIGRFFELREPTAAGHGARMALRRQEISSPCIEATTARLRVAGDFGDDGMPAFPSNPSLYLCSRSRFHCADPSPVLRLRRQPRLPPMATDIAVVVISRASR